MISLDKRAQEELRPLRISPESGIGLRRLKNVSKKVLALLILSLVIPLQVASAQADQPEAVTPTTSAQTNQNSSDSSAQKKSAAQEASPDQVSGSCCLCNLSNERCIWLYHHSSIRLWFYLFTDEVQCAVRIPLILVRARYGPGTSRARASKGLQIGPKGPN